MNTLNKKELINEKNFKTQIGKKLLNMLQKVWNNEDFIIGVMNNVRGDEKRKQLIDFIEADNTDSDDITLESLAIAGIIERK